ncbi:ABC transporter ATP-binding protein [Pseudomonas sp. S36]|nr:ABC transporter ATP-binding protein [Pseudomonas sp. S36]
MQTPAGHKTNDIGPARPTHYAGLSLVSPVRMDALTTAIAENVDQGAFESSKAGYSPKKRERLWIHL